MPGNRRREKPASLVAGQSYFRKAGVEHNLINAGEQEVVFIETELMKMHAEAG